MRLALFAVFVSLPVLVSAAPSATATLRTMRSGKCEGPEFKSAGGHFNPAAREHGLDNPEGSPPTAAPPSSSTPPPTT